MAVAERKASVVWEGDFRVGSGTLQGSSGAFGGLPLSFNERLESNSDVTSPEELMASAHASCYAMSLSNTLASNGSQPDRLEVTSVCHLDRTTEGLTIRRMQLDVKGQVQRMSTEEFEAMARRADEKCAVSNALRASVEIELTASLLPS
jgi:lipoyl-dependent peroxiredoxin